MPWPPVSVELDDGEPDDELLGLELVDVGGAADELVDGGGSGVPSPFVDDGVDDSPVDGSVPGSVGSDVGDDGSVDPSSPGPPDRKSVV